MRGKEKTKEQVYNLVHYGPRFKAGKQPCCKPLFQAHADQRPLSLEFNNAEREQWQKRRKETKENELKQSKTLGMVYAAGYFPRVLSKNNLVKMRTENHRPLLSPEHMQLWSVWYF